ncbi:DoxX family protein [Nocardia sp. NPDC049149]|uniref:DoxX family protein n=1 Tax=Nocardia sp. NPDC049149 TaxID=3364315 RepID=UPI00371C4306
MSIPKRGGRIAAAIGLVLHFGLAIGFHVKGKDWGNIAAPIVALSLAAAALALRMLSM